MNSVVKEIKTSPRIVYLFIPMVALMVFQLFIISHSTAPAEEILGGFSALMIPISIVEGVHLVAKEWKGGSIDVVRTCRGGKGGALIGKFCGGIVWAFIGVLPVIIPGVLFMSARYALMFLLIPPYIALGMFFGSLVRSYLLGFVGALFSSALLSLPYPFIWTSPELCVASLIGADSWLSLFSTEAVRLEGHNPALLLSSIVLFTAVFLALSEAVE